MWGWNHFKALSVGLIVAAILALVEESGNWPVHLLDAHIVMIPKEGDDETPIGQRPFDLFTSFFTCDGPQSDSVVYNCVGH